MRYFLGVSLILNVVTFILLGQTGAESVDGSVAKIAVREKLEKLSALPHGANLIITSSCTEQRGNRAAVSVVGRTDKQTSMFDGLPITKNLEFTYQAKVQSQCSPLNLNCYDIDSIDFIGTTKLLPKI